MCGRYTFKLTWSQLHRVMTFTAPPGELFTSYNIAPTQQAPIVRDRPSDSAEPERVIEMATWGLLPHWADKPGPINARCESLESKPMFRSALQKRRCIVPASGFYEWQAIEGEKAKRPWYIYRADGEPMLMAGLYEWREDRGPSYTIITTPCNEFISQLHDRMPAILEPDAAARWLAQGEVALLSPAAAGVLTAHRVSPRVNAPRNNDAALIEAACESEGGLWA
jgi:putative SOS response-associated peptidase YedK